MPTNNFNIQGLSQEQVMASREKHGKNSVDYKPKNTFLEVLEGFLKDPMVILLLVASVIYFVSEQTDDGILWFRQLSWFQVFPCIKIIAVKMLWRN
jgi:Ca2+-transporting ATPase